MTTKKAFALLTVKDLIATLRTLPPDGVIYLASDAEGNDFNPLDYIAQDEDDKKMIALMPMHEGWEYYGGENTP